MEIVQLRQLKEGATQQEWLLRGERALFIFTNSMPSYCKMGLPFFAFGHDHPDLGENQQYAGQGQLSTLAQHYQQKIIQIHVMNEYARSGLGKPLPGEPVKDYQYGGTFLLISKVAARFWIWQIAKAPRNGLSKSYTTEFKSR